MPNASWRRWGVASAMGGESPTLGEGAGGGTERAERSGGLHKRSAEVWGNPLRARGAKLPLEVREGRRCGQEQARSGGGAGDLGSSGGEEMFSPLRSCKNERRLFHFLFRIAKDGMLTDG